MASSPSRRASRRCPTCGGASVESYRPFCSKRCADVDLARWLKGVYVLPGDTPSEDESRPGSDTEDAPPVRH